MLIPQLARFATRVVIRSLILLLVATTSAAASADDWRPRDSTLVLGKVTPDPGRTYKSLRRMIDYVVPKMRDLGITHGVIKMARNNRQMVKMLRLGEVDWVSETAYSAMQFQRKAKAEILLQRWKNGVGSYHAVIFVRQDSGINSLSELVGHSIALEDEGSTTSFFLPAAAFTQIGVPLERLYSPRESSYLDHVGYVFSNAEITSSTWVHKGIVTAGAFSNIDWEKEKSLPGVYRRAFKIIHKTKPVPRGLEVVRADMLPAVRARLREILLDMPNDPEGRKVLKRYQSTTQFQPLRDIDLARLAELREQIAAIENSL